MRGKHPYKPAEPREVRETGLSEQDLRAFMAKAARPMTLREIAGALKLRHIGRRALTKIIAKWKRRGEVEELSRGRYALVGKSAHSAPPRQPAKAEPGRHHAAPRVSQSAPPQSEAGLLRGRLVAHQDGYGFVVLDAPVPGMDGDLFIGRDAIGDAMHGDRVLARIARRDRGGRAEGRIARVLERAHSTVVGLFRYGASGNTVAPYEARLTEIVIPPGEEMPAALAAKLGIARPANPRARLPQLDGAVVNVELTRFPHGGVSGAGRVVEILGHPGALGVDIEIILRKHHIPHEFPPEVVHEAARVALAPGEPETAGRRDYRALPIVTIDGETARDFDDAVYAERTSSGWRLQVHIADVAHYVRPASALDLEARLRGTSVYFPDRAVPMLPEALSNEICSLRPGVDRLVMSAELELDDRGEITRADFAPGVIRSAARMTYTDVHKVLDGDPETSAIYAHLAENFRTMRDLALVLNARRRRLGSIDFDLPEPVIEFDPEGRMTNIGRSERNIAHRLIEEFMLAANQAVAHFLIQQGVGALHRVHEKPDAKRVLEFEELAHAFGYSLGIPGLAERRLAVRHGSIVPRGREGRSGRGSRERPMYVTLPADMDIDIRPQNYQRLTDKIAGKPEERILSYLMLRSLKQARYDAHPLGHFALAFSEYCHFTSPIRRYPDLVVHRALKSALANPPAPGSAQRSAEEITRGPYREAELATMASETSDAERRAVSAERELMDWKTAQFMESRLGDQYDALIISVQKFGFFVELMEVFVEGLVPINRLEEQTGERCVYRERDHVIIAGNSANRPAQSRQSARSGREANDMGGHAWRLGDLIRVVAERIDPIRRRVEFGLAESSNKKS
jgi:ribonuclease R